MKRRGSLHHCLFRAGCQRIAGYHCSHLCRAGMRKPGWDNQGTTVATAITSLPFYNDSGSMEDLAAASILRFSPCNPTHSDCARPLTLWIDAKNAGRSATVSVYRIDIEGWLCSAQNTGYNVEVGPEADLAGVAPSAVLTVAMADSMTAVERVKVDVPDTAGRRGSFVVDVAAGGSMCRCAAGCAAMRYWRVMPTLFRSCGHMWLARHACGFVHTRTNTPSCMHFRRPHHVSSHFVGW